MRVFRKRKPYNEDDPPLPDIVYQMAAEQAVRFVATNPPLQNSHNAYNMGEQDALYNMPYVTTAENTNIEIPEGGTGRPSRASSAFNRVRSVFNRGRTTPREQCPNESRQRFNRAGSPDHFRQRSLGSPLNFRSRPGSPQLGRSRPGSPRLFGSRPGSPRLFGSRPGSPRLFGSRPGSPFHFGQQERSSSPYHYAQTEETSPQTYHYVQEDRASSPQHFIPPTRSTPADVQRRLAVAQLSQDLQQAERQQRHQQQTLMSSYPTHFMPQYQQPYYSLMNSNVTTQGYPTMTQPPMYTYY